MKRPGQRRPMGLIVGVSAVIVLGVLGALTSARITSRRSDGPFGRPPAVDLTRFGRPRPLPELIRRAHHIWRGTVLNVDQAAKEMLLRLTDGEMLLARSDEAQFFVERVLKGRQVSGVKPIVLYTTPGGEFLPGLEPGQHGLVFLDGMGRVVDPVRPIVLLSPGASEGPPSKDPLEAVKHELLWGGALDELVSAFPVDFSQIEPTLRRMARSPDDATAANGLRALVHYASRPALAAAVESALARAPDPGPECRRALDGIATLSDPALAAVIDPLLDTEVFEWRLAALTALGGMRSRDHIHRFAAALYEDDPNMQFEAVRGLGAALDIPREYWASPQFYINHRVFAESGPAYVAAWKRWWESEGRAHYGKQ